MFIGALDTMPQDIAMLVGWYVFLGCITLAIYLKNRKKSDLLQKSHKPDRAMPSGKKSLHNAA